jgi:hypothetical protein
MDLQMLIAQYLWFKASIHVHSPESQTLGNSSPRKLESSIDQVIESPSLLPFRMRRNDPPSNYNRIVSTPDLPSLQGGPKEQKKLPLLWISNEKGELVKHWLPAYDNAETHLKIFLFDTSIAMKKQPNLCESNTEALYPFHNDQRSALASSP